MLNGKAIIIYLIVVVIKRHQNEMSQYFSKPYEPFRGDINVNS